MKLSNFDFELPERLIALHPALPRDTARLMVIDRITGEIGDSHFYDLPDFLKPGDFLVFNKSKVIPARLFGKAGDKDIEVLLTSPCYSEPTGESMQKNPGFRIPACRTGRKSGMATNIWQAKAKPGKRLKISSEIRFSDRLSAEVKAEKEGIFLLRFNLRGGDFWREIERIGEMPLPPYILKARRERHGESIDKSDYQTVFADKPGSVAAPTAGLHFTNELLEKIKAKGCEIGFVDLHVGLGTFEPIRAENIEDHKIHSEYFELSQDLAAKLNKAKKEGRHIIAVGTTTVRVLESCQKNGILKPQSGETSIYIYPGYKFGFVDGMITNFHLPKSSLLLLVSAFYSKDKTIEAYKRAIKSNYRFYSYGDGMLIS